MIFATFQWTHTIEVPNSFNPMIPHELEEARKTAWEEMTHEDGELTSTEQGEPDASPEEP